MARTHSTANTEHRRAAILAAMLPVMARNGYERATIQAIACEAGLTPGLIHYHFKSKHEILVELIKAIMEYARARFERAVAETTRPIDRLRAHLEAWLGLGAGAAPDMVAVWVMIGAEAVRQPEVRALYQEAVAAELAALTQLLAECLAEQKRSTDRASTIAAGLLALMEGAFQLSSAAAGVMPTGYAANAAMGFATLSIAAAKRA